MRLARHAALVFALAGPGLARAQPVFTDDFESGGLLKADLPPGPWDRVTMTPASNQLLVAPMAAKSGQLGLRVVDADPSAGQSAQGGVQADFVGSNDAFMRAWFRLVSSNGQGNFSLVYAQDPTNTLLRDITFDAPSGRFQALGASSGATTPGEWNLLELYVRGFGAPAGSASAFVNGQRLVDEQGIDWSGKRLQYFMVGEVWDNAGGFVGELDFDGVALATAPLPSHLVLSADAVDTGPCRPVRVGLAESTGSAAAAAWYDVDVELSASEGAFSSDAACTVAMNQVRIALGATEARVFFRPTSEAVVTLTARHSDFLEARLLQRGLDPTAVQPGALRVGCSCSGTADCSCLAALFAAACLRRRRSGALAVGSRSRPAQ